MARAHQPTAAVSAPSVRGLVISALIGLAFAAASTWVHYQILRDPLYSSFCDVNATFSCTEAYTSRFGSVAGIPVALIGVLYFAFVLVLIGLCRRAPNARENLPGYIFAASTLGLAGTLYLAYASFFILEAVCLLCVGTYAAIISLFLLSGAAARFPMSSLPGRALSDLRALVRTPAALTATLAFIAAAVLAVMVFPGEPIAAATGASASSAASQATAAPPPAQLPPNALQQLEQFLSQQPRVPIVANGGDAAVVIIKFNDYQCPPCGQTFREYKPILARLQQRYPGKIAFITRDFPLEPECNSSSPRELHPSACEAAVAVRLAREKGKADAMEDFLFGNQPSMTPTMIKEGLSTIAGVTDFDARYAKTLELVRGDIAQGIQLKVGGTPTFFMNGIRLPSLRAEFFEAAVEWELKHATAGAR